MATFAPRISRENRSASGRALWKRPGGGGCKSHNSSAPVIFATTFQAFPWRCPMPLPVDLLLSRLEPLRAYLGRGADIDSELMEALEAALPKKQVDKLVKLLDKLMQEPQGAQVLVLTMTYLLDEWLKAGDDRLQRINKDSEPFAWLATSDHLEVVQTFRELL